MNDLLEVLITGSSRPQLFPYFYDSFKKMCIIRDTPQVTMHEDFVFPGQSEQLVNIVGLRYPEIILDTDNPARGLGWTIEHYLFQRIKTKYMFYLQEDWEFERPIDIDQLIWIMEENPDINVIFFNKIKNSGSINRQKQDEVIYSGHPFCVYHGWTMLPGIWRTDFVRSKWPRGVLQRPEAAMNSQFGSHTQRTPVDYVRRVLGVYIYGRQGEYRYVRHLGNDWRMAAWQLENKGNQVVPGGNHNSKTMDLDYMAPWVPYPKRPVQRGDLADD